jgi:hypothetical protein
MVISSNFHTLDPTNIRCRGTKYIRQGDLAVGFVHSCAYREICSLVITLVVSVNKWWRIECLACMYLLGT